VDAVRRTLSSEPTLRAVRDLLRIDGPGHALPDAFLKELNLLLDCDGIGFNHLDSTAETQYFTQGYEADEGFWLFQGPDFLEPEDWREWWGRYWDSPCSFPERTGTYHHVMMLSDFLTDRQRWSSFPADEQFHEMMLVLPDGPGRTLRLIVSRESGAGFTEDDRFLLTLLMPHIERMYRAREHHPTVTLTPRQRQLVHLLQQGYTNAQIARRLSISEGTVRTHLEHVYSRLGVNNRVAAVVRADEVLQEGIPDLSTTRMA
jgi:DNA-binding CsgD family transcriptional regulator